MALRKQNLSIYDISRALEEAGSPLSPAAISLILKEEGFARLPRRRDEERPPGTRPDISPVADVRQLDLSSASSNSIRGPVPLLALSGPNPFDQLMEQAGLPVPK